MPSSKHSAAFSGPIYINTRDRVSDLKAQIAWFERAGHERIIILDNDSTYPPLLEYLEQTPHEVQRLRTNLGARALWLRGKFPDEWYAETDPDIIPTEDCPLDLLDHLLKLAQKHKEKAGVGLYIDDVEFPTKAWEQELCRPEIFRGDCYWAPVDTTLAVYPPNIDFTPNAVRSAAPYLARHMGWYASLDDPEFAYYTNRAVRGPNGTSWFHQREA